MVEALSSANSWAPSGRLRVPRGLSATHRLEQKHVRLYASLGVDTCSHVHHFSWLSCVSATFFGKRGWRCVGKELAKTRARSFQLDVCENLVDLIWMG